MTLDITKVKRPAPLKLTGFCDEVELPVKEAPSAGHGVITRLDSETLIFDSHSQGSFIVGVGLLFQIVGLIFLPYMTFVFVKMMFASTGEDGGSSGVFEWILDIFILLGGVGAICFASYIVYFGIFAPAPCPVIFNRRKGLIFGSHKGKPIALDWKKVKPFLLYSVNLSAGAQRQYYLTLVEREDSLPKGQKQKKGYGFVLSTGYSGWANCHAMWEFIRRYMEDKPESLPEVELSPAGGFEARMLDEGPYWEFHERQGLMADLRYRNGFPQFNHWISFMMVAFAPAFLMNVFRMLIRRRVKLPAEWLPVAISEPNPYQVRPAQPEDMAIRSKAARYIALWMTVCLGLGTLFWVWLVRLIAFR
ncbi:DUF6708 domain-containing protein [Chitinimonas sp. BJB300]|uniref:DUF6708 domain-containing protein n=1 Tax=Chitinimonas sp. BJB300 TaxID=1559339 RepID=UPI000C11BAA4|nr:hypothetical protein [Chitinimonas sp. BJB300]PHV10410.1 hypothetical protein CSQ89_16340 [Chitinimonas sp. BJB300]TSJ88119.1 hypothetical protein FG002_011375 [Chitinimonas sp. BJB300]